MLGGIDETGRRLDTADVLAMADEEEVELLTAQQVADRLKIGKSTVYLLCRRGEMPHITIHRSVRIPSDALRRWLRSRLRGADSIENAGPPEA